MFDEVVSRMVQNKSSVPKLDVLVERYQQIYPIFPQKIKTSKKLRRNRFRAAFRAAVAFQNILKPNICTILAFQDTV